MKQLHQTNKPFSPKKSQKTQKMKNHSLPEFLRLL